MSRVFLIGVLSLVVWVGVLSEATHALHPTNNDPLNQIRFDTPAEADAKRTELTNWIWSDGLPTSTLPAVAANIGMVGALTGLNPSYISRVDRLDADVSGWDFHAISYLLHPVNTTNADRLAIVHQGHIDYSGRFIAGVGATIDHLLEEGFSVIAMQMPLCGWNNDTTVVLPSGTVTVNSHTEMFQKLVPPTLADGGAFRLFLEPVVQNINHFLNANPGTQEISMMGLSGGGWTTHLAPAVDTRIQVSIPVAGSAPLYARNAGGWSEDAEQFYYPLYDENIAPNGSGGGVATWQEIYALSGYGSGRRQTMVTNLHDSCCFFGTWPDDFKNHLSNVVSGDLGAGQWQHHYDSTHTGHQISSWTMDNVIDVELGLTQPPPVGLSTNLQNQDFETNYGAYFNDDVNGWREFADFIQGAGIWNNSSGALDGVGFPDWTSEGRGSLIARPNYGDDDAWIFQSLGTVSAEDVGKTLVLSADLGARDDPVFGSGLMAGDLVVAFRKGTHSGGTLGSVVGISDELHVEIVPGYGPIGLVTKTAFYTPSAEDIGQEIFVVVSLHATSGPTVVDQNQYQVDDVVLRFAIPGDTNGNNIVDAVDAAALADHWGTTVTPGDVTAGDFNNDGWVNSLDASILAANWGNHLAEASAVPEPSTNVLLLMTGVVIARLRWHRGRHGRSTGAKQRTKGVEFHDQAPEFVIKAWDQVGKSLF